MKTLRKGHKGQEVRYLQERLLAKGYRVTLDSVFGTETEVAVCQFQVSEQLKPDAIVGPQTWNRLLTEGHVAPPSSLLSTHRKELLRRIPDSAGSQERAVLEVALAALGAREVPNGSNKGPDIDKFVGGYNEYWGIADNNGYPWCAMAVSSWIGIGLRLGDSSRLMDWKQHPFERFLGGAKQVEDWGKANGRYTSARKGTPAPSGSAFVINRNHSGSDRSSSANAGHAGLVILDMDDKVLTIEGNISNKVDSRERKKKDVRGFVTWW